jgi:hypothetical protein
MMMIKTVVFQSLGVAAVCCTNYRTIWVDLMVVLDLSGHTHLNKDGCESKSFSRSAIDEYGQKKLNMMSEKISLTAG